MVASRRREGWRFLALTPAIVIFLALAPIGPPCRAQTSPEGVPGATPEDAPVRQYPTAVPPNYVLSPNDLIEVKVFQEDDMDWTVRITTDSTVNLPLCGSIDVLHKTPADLAQIVKTQLQNGYLRNPQVSVMVIEFSKRRFTILGEVTKPGQIDFPDNSDLNLLDAVGLAGGYTRQADAGRVYIKREIGGKEVVMTVDAKRMARGKIAPFKILPGDIITVGQSIF